MDQTTIQLDSLTELTIVHEASLGELLIAILLTLLITLYVTKWIYELTIGRRGK